MLIAVMPVTTFAADPGIFHRSDQVYDLGPISSGAVGGSTGLISFTLDADGDTNVCAGADEVVADPLFEVGWSLLGCGPIESGDVSFDDLTSAALLTTTIDGQFCDTVNGVFSCTPRTFTASGTFDVTARFTTWHDNSYGDFGTCFLRTAVAAKEAPVEGSFTVDGITYSGIGTLLHRVIQLTSNCT